jgi:hypothetical protein
MYWAGWTPSSRHSTPRWTASSRLWTKTKIAASLGARVAELERTNADLKAEIGRHAAARKTLPPLVTALLAKTGIESQEKINVATLDKALALLTVDQRIAVKAQMARAGIIE